MAIPNPASGLVVECNDSNSIQLTWIDNSADEAGFKIMRSMDGVSYSLIVTTIADVITYSDTTVDAGTLYFYKIVATNGSGDAAASAPGSAVSQTCEQAYNKALLALPRSDDDELFNELADAVEQALDDRICLACSSSGSLVLDYSGCDCYEVYVTENINSISMPFCESGKCIDFIVLEGESYSICGFPTSSGMEAGDCGSQITGGPGGTRYHFEMQDCIMLGGFGVPAGLLPLTISCNPTDSGCANCEMDCTLAISTNPHLVHLCANGGVPFTGAQGPYNWTTTKGLIWESASARLMCHKGKTTLLKANQCIVFGPCAPSDCGAGSSSNEFMLQRAIRYGIPFFWDGTLNPQGCLQLGFAWIKLCNGDYTPSSWIDFCNGDPTYTDLSTGGWELYSVGATVPCIASGGAHCLGTAIPTITTAIWTSPMTGIGYPHPDFFLPSADFGVLTDLRTLALKNSGCCDCILGDGAVVTVTDAANQSVAVVIDNIG